MLCFWSGPKTPNDQRRDRAEPNNTKRSAPNRASGSPQHNADSIMPHRRRSPPAIAPCQTSLRALLGEPFIEPAQEINDLIARRAYELFDPAGSPTTMLLRDWLLRSRKSCCSTGGRHRDGTAFTIHAECRVSAKKSGSTSSPRSLCNHRQAARVIRSKGRTTIYSESALLTSSEWCTCRLRLIQIQ